MVSLSHKDALLKKIDFFIDKEGCDWLKILKQPRLGGFGYHLLPPAPAFLSTGSPISLCPPVPSLPILQAVSPSPRHPGLLGEGNAIVGVKQVHSSH